MEITYVTILVILGIVAFGIGAMTKKASPRKKSFMIGGIILVVAFLGFAGVIAPLNQTVSLGGKTTVLMIGGNQQVQPVGNYQGYQPTATYSTLNHFSSVSVTGTSYYKAGSAKAGTTAISNTDPSTNYQYWVSNTTYYVQPYSFSGAGTKSIVNDVAYQNGSVTITGYDLINDKAGLASGTSNNASLSSGTARIKFNVLGSATTSNIPFGGVLAIEANSTISQIVCTGVGISPASGRYQVTYTPSATTHRAVLFDIVPGYDVSSDGLIGVTKTFECDFTSPSATSGSSYYVKLIPANYYYVNTDGSVQLDTENKLNGGTTRQGLGGTVQQFYWA